VPSSPPATDSASEAPPAPAKKRVSFWEGARAAPWVLTTYFAEGLPFSIVRQLSGEYLTSMGASPQTITSTSLFGFAWNLKLLWSPLVDRYGTIRRWLIATEALLGITIVALAWWAGRGALDMAMRVLWVAAVLAATHDIAIDGFYLDALDKDQQALFSGVRIPAYRGALLAGKGLLVLAGVLQVAAWDRAAAWRVVFLVAGALLVVLAAAHAWLLPSPARSSPSSPAGAPGTRYLDAFASYLEQPKIAWSLLFIVLYKAGDAMMFAVSAPFLKSLGFGDLLRGTVGVVGVVASMVTSIVAGGMVAVYGLRRTLTPIAIVQSIAILLYVGLAWLKPGAVLVAVVAVVEQVAGAVGDAALAVFLMRRCLPSHKAAHFAIGSALMSVAATLVGFKSGALVTAIGYPAFFAIAFAASLPGVILTWFVPKE
jgi:MFS transporter, PAT family, beta-lactamase induction signal transducer AmpG